MHRISQGCKFYFVHRKQQNEMEVAFLGRSKLTMKLVAIEMIHFVLEGVHPIWVLDDEIDVKETG